MSKYNVGDKVKIREDLVEGKMYGKHMFINDMVKFKGKEAIIRMADDCNKDYMLGERGFMWTDEMFEGLVEDIIKETPKESTPRFKIGDKVELISVDSYDKAYGLEIGDIGVITNIEYFRDACTIKFSKVSSDKAIFYNQIKLVEEETIIEDEIKPKYVKCTASKFSYINKNEVYKVVSESETTYSIMTKESEFLQIYSKHYFIEVDSPIEKGDTTTVKLNGKVGKAIRNSIDEPSIEIGILIATCRLLSISEEKIQDIIDILFDNEDTKAKYGCENAIMKNDITRALSILDKYKEE